MKQIALIFSLITLLVLAGCEKETTVKKNKYEFFVSSENEKARILYNDSLGNEIDSIATTRWTYEFSKAGLNYIHIRVFKIDDPKWLNLVLIRNDTAIVMNYCVGYPSDVRIMGYF